MLYFIRFIQAGIIIGLIPLYIYMLKSRSKYYADKGGFLNSFLNPQVYQK